MGLDMYFYKTKNDDVLNLMCKLLECREEERKSYIDIGSYRIKLMSAESEYETEFHKLHPIVYLRKVNCAHGLLTKGCEKTDNMPFILKKDEIIKMQEHCKQIIKSAVVGNKYDKKLAKKLLPIKDGLFWGPREYDAEYFETVKEAYSACQTILSSTDFDNESIVYIADY